MSKEIVDRTSGVIINLLDRINIIHRNGHFVYTSGTHGDTFINKAAIYPNTSETRKIGKLFAEKYQNSDIDIVVGPAIGGIVLAQWTAYLLGELKHKDVFAIFTEKNPQGTQIFKRGYDELIKGKEVLIVEDIVNTGKSIRQVIDCVKSAGGNIIAATAIVNRSPDKVNSETFQIPFSALCEIPMEIYSPEECPLCKAGVPINTNLGHGS